MTDDSEQDPRKAFCPMWCRMLFCRISEKNAAEGVECSYVEKRTKRLQGLFYDMDPQQGDQGDCL